MSTGSDLSDYYENGPLGHRYVIHLKSKDEICLHALTLLQSDLVPCYMPVHLSEDETQLLIDLSGCYGDINEENWNDYSIDGLHPWPWGAEKIAECIADYIGAN